MEFVLDYAAIVTSAQMRAPVIVLVAIADASNLSTIYRECGDLLCRKNLLGPPFDHRRASIEDAFGLAHFWQY